MRGERVGFETHLFAGLRRNDARTIAAGGGGDKSLCAEIVVEHERELAGGEALGGGFGFRGSKEVEQARVSREIE